MGRGPGESVVHGPRTLRPRYATHALLLKNPGSAPGPDFGWAVVSWALWSRQPSLPSVATVLTSRNHLTVVVVIIVVTPISDQDLMVLVTWTNVPSLSTSSPVDPLTGVHLEVPCPAGTSWPEERKDQTWSGWSQDPDPTWGKVNYSSSIGLVGGMCGLLTNSQLPIFFFFSFFL